MNNLTWIDLFEHLTNIANDIKNVGKFDWSAPVMIHNAETGDEYNCDTMYVSDKRGEDRFVLMTNIEQIFAESETDGL